MTEAIAILAELQRRGVIVSVEGDTLCLKPRRVLDDTLLDRVREAKPALLEALREGLAEGLATCGSPHCSGCYDVGDGRKIHPPRCGAESREWLEHWEPKGKTQ